MKRQDVVHIIRNVTASLKGIDKEEEMAIGQNASLYYVAKACHAERRQQYEKLERLAKELDEEV